ncbi:ATP-grasp domain-containing protein [Streptomyces virginiae]|uniref:ATP-grasp domain-containing protein n=1 Tax=Streptomyces virginiae TaxID=1961 RepID=UPI000ACFA67D|nr:hypothetical protein [Streptomyces virginiae]
MNAIGIVTCARDIHARAVQVELEQKFKNTCHIFSVDTIRDQGGCSWSLHHDSSPTLATDVGEIIDIRSLGALWMRRRGRRKSFGYSGLTDSPYWEFVAANDDSAVSGILAQEFKGAWVDNPGAITAAENKITQLSVARKVGLRSPATLVSQNPEQIIRFHEEHGGEIIVKSLRSVGATQPTRRVTKELLKDDASMRLCPAIYQEAIEGTEHLRVHIFGRHSFAAIIKSEELDWRRNSYVETRQFSLPSHLEEKLRNILSSLRLSMGIFDLKISKEGEYVWLEVNPQGQFLFMEGLSGIALTNAVAQHLREQA